LKSRSVFIELRNDRLDIAVFDGGRCIRARRQELHLEEDPGEWEHSLRAAVPKLQALVDELNIHGLPTTVAYRSPAHATELSSLEIKSKSKAAAAASLSCLDALSYSTLAAVHGVEVLGRDAGGPHPRTHTVATADRDDIVAAMCAFVEQAGLRFDAVTPINAAVLAGLASTALKQRTGMWAPLFIGETTSFFLVVRDGRLLFARRIGVGLQTLARALTRPTRHSTTGETIELDLHAARTILQRHGLPERETVVDEANQITGAEVVPLLQPVFQRFIVELRQSIRFSLSDDDRQHLTLTVIGPGASVPGINKLFSDELNITSEIDPSDRQYDFDSPCSEGSEIAFLARNRRSFRALGLQSKRDASQRRTAAMRRWLVTGAAAALLVIAFDAARYQVALREARNQAETVSGRVANWKTLQQTSRNLQEALEQWRTLDVAIEENFQTGFDFHALFKELTHQTPANVKITTLRLRQEDNRGVGNISGYVLLDDPDAIESEDEPNSDALQQFIENLRQSPLFQDVSLGAVQKGNVGSRSGLRFEAHVICAAVSKPETSPRVAQTSEEHANVANQP